MYHYAGNNPIKYVDPDGRKTHELTDEQWEVVQSDLNQTVENLQKLVNQLKEIDFTKDEAFDSANTNFLEIDLTDVEDVVLFRAKCQTLIDKLSNMTREDFKYDDFDNNPDKAGTYGWCFFVVGSTIYLGDQYFKSKNTGYNTRQGVLVHEGMHLVGLAIDVPPRPYGVDNANKNWNKRLNADNWEYFYEYLFTLEESQR